MIDLAGVPTIYQSQSPYAQAFKRMEENLPPYPTALMEKLGLRRATEWFKSSQPDFLGWSGAIGGCFGIRNFMAIPNGVDLNDIGYVGIWRGKTASKTHIIYCVVPSMNHGEVLVDLTVDLGRPRIRIGWRQEDLEVLVTVGYELMVKMIAQYGEYKEGE